MSDQVPDAAVTYKNLARLAAEVERLSNRVGDLSERVTAIEAGGTDGDFGDAIDELGQQVALLAEQFSAEAASSTGPVPVAWLDVDADQAPIVLRDLTDWIGTVLSQYEVGGLAPCWYRHPDVVQVLLDLRSAWMAAYRNPEGKVVLALDWHQRYFPAAKQYVNALSCTDRDHSVRRTSFVVDAGALERYAAWWGSGRAPESEPAWVQPGRQTR